MKKANRVIAIIAAALIGAGAVVLTIGAVFGGDARDSRFWPNWAHRRGMGMFIDNDDYNHDNDDSFDGYEDFGGYNNYSPNNITDGTNVGDWKTILDESYTDVKSLDIDAGACEVTIVAGDKFAIKVDSTGTEVISKVENGEWEIETKYREKYRVDNRFKMVITLPKDFKAEEMDITIGAGTLVADRLSAKKLELEVGAGEITVDSVESEGGKLECGMGTITLNGYLKGRTKVDCGMGSIVVNMAGKEADYGYKASVGMGSVRFGSDGGAAGMISSGSRNTESPNRLDISCGMGSAEILFTE